MLELRRIGQLWKSMIENNIATNIRRVLGRLYGQENVAVSVKGTLNVERVLQEYTQYKVPENLMKTIKPDCFSGRICRASSR